MSARRNAEINVIEAATFLVKSQALNQYMAMRNLERAVQALEALGLEEPTATPTTATAPQTAHDAATSMRHMVGALSGEVFLQFLAMDRVGLTADGVQARLKGTHQSVSPRVSELAKKGWIYDTGRTRATRSGRQATVYAPTILAKEAAALVEGWSW